MMRKLTIQAIRCMTMFDEKYKFTCVERFLRYVKYDTRSDDNATSFPSTEKQKILLKDLAAEFKKEGLKDACMDEWGYVIGTLPANSDKNSPHDRFYWPCGYFAPGIR